MSGVCLYVRTRSLSGLLGGAVVKNPPANTGDARDVGLIPRSGRSPGEENGTPVHYFCLENSMDRGAWRAIVNSIATPPPATPTPTRSLSNFFFFFFFLIYLYLFIYFFNFIFKLYITVLVLPNIKMNPPQVYMCSPS